MYDVVTLVPFWCYFQCFFKERPHDPKEAEESNTTQEEGGESSTTPKQDGTAPPQKGEGGTHDKKGGGKTSEGDLWGQRVGRVLRLFRLSW